MAWTGILGHDSTIELLLRAERRGRLANAYLWVGPSGIGKRTLAQKWAQALLCAQRGPQGEPCGHCPSCSQVLAGTHPDLDLVAKPADKSSIPVELFIGDPEHRMQEGLCHRVGLKPFFGGRKIALIDDADFLNEEGANCLLKTLEEPPPRSLLILVGTSADRQLPTIRSRCQLVRFRPLEPADVARLLVEQGHVAEAAEAARLAAQSGGSLEQALLLADPELWTFRRRLFDQLADGRFDSVALARETAAFIDAAGKEAPPRRARFRQVVGFAAALYRQALRRLAGCADGADAELVRAAGRLAGGPHFDSARGLAAVERCLEALWQIDRNANQAILVDAWIDDLGLAAAGRPLAPSSAGA